MADSFETLFTVNNKNYTECKTGFQVFATSGSQKAVIKDIKIKNEGGKAIQIRKNGLDGFLVSTSTSTGVFSGNEIFDNSETLHVKTDVAPSLTSIITASTANGTSSNNVGTNTKGYGEWKKYGVQYDATWEPTTGLNNSNYDYIGQTKGQPHGDLQFTTGISDDLYDGHFLRYNDYVYGFHGHMQYGNFPFGSGGSSLKGQVLRWAAATVNNWSSTNATTGYTVINDWKGIHLFDNQRYLYVIGRNTTSGAGENNIWKYDTKDRTSTELRTRSYNNSADEDIVGVGVNNWSAYYMEEDGVPFAWCIPQSNAGGAHLYNSTSGTGLPFLVNLNTGVKRHLLYSDDEHYNQHSPWNWSVRRTIGCAQLTTGSWILMLGTVQSTSQTNNGNYTKFYDLGSSLQDWITNEGPIAGTTKAAYNSPSGQGNQWLSGSSGNTVMGSSFSTSNYGDSACARQGCNGQYFHSQMCSQAVGIKNRLFFFNSYGFNQWTLPTQCMLASIDLSAAIAGGQFHTCWKFYGGTGTSYSTSYPQGYFSGMGTRFMADPDVVESSFGKVSVQGQGILIT